MYAKVNTIGAEPPDAAQPWAAHSLGPDADGWHQRQALARQAAEGHTQVGAVAPEADGTCNARAQQQ